MQADDFIRKWSAGSPAHALGERAGAQAHFIDLCRVLGVSRRTQQYSFQEVLQLNPVSYLRAMRHHWMDHGDLAWHKEQQPAIQLCVESLIRLRWDRRRCVHLEQPGC